MSSSFQDNFDREDGPIGSDYLIPCGEVSIAQESVIPVGLSGTSPQLYDPTVVKTQVLVTSTTMDGPDLVVRAVWARDLNPATGEPPLSIDTDPAFTILARMTKDPLIVDLGVDEDPYCYDQGYGLRVTCPEDGAAPILKFVKFQPLKRAPGLRRPNSGEPDGATVLASYTLQSTDLNLDPDWSGIGDFPYQGIWQDMRLRIRRSENMVVLDAFLNDRHLNEPALSFTDRTDPLWSIIGLQGFEFLSGTDNSQPSGSSPYHLIGQSLMRCSIFSSQTVKDFTQPVLVQPENAYTYQKVTEQVVLLVEKNGDAKYNQTVQGRTKLDTYLEFVIQAESHIITAGGFYKWLWRDSVVYLRNGVANYELPEDCDRIVQIRPGNFSGPPIEAMPQSLFRSRYGAVSGAAGPPRFYMLRGQGINNRQEIMLFPTPCTLTSPTTGEAIEVSLDADPYIVVEYRARAIRPSKPDQQIPFVPQQHMHVLIWQAAKHAMMLDTDMDNASMVTNMADQKLALLVRDMNRGDSENSPEVVHQIADVRQAVTPIPLTRIDQLRGFGTL